MKIKIIIILVAFIAVALLASPVLVPGKKDASAQINAPLVAEETFHDLGTIAMKDGLVETEYQLTNTGDETITIGKVYTLCMCTTASITGSDGKEKGKFGMPGHQGTLSRADTTVAPGESVSVKAVYDPAAHGPAGVGLAQRSVFLETDSSVTPEVELRFKAMVTN